MTLYTLMRTITISKRDIRRFRVRIPGGILTSCWPNGKAPDYGFAFLRFLDTSNRHFSCQMKIASTLWLSLSPTQWHRADPRILGSSSIPFGILHSRRFSIMSSSTSSSSFSMNHHQEPSPNPPKNQPPPPMVKNHCFTVCMVPPSTEPIVWEKLTQARIELQDPGVFRWPPHVNLLYPFCNVFQTVKGSSGDGLEKEMQFDANGGRQDTTMESSYPLLEQLQQAVQNCCPFVVTLQDLGTFGGAHRGVLYMIPSSSYKENNNVHVNDMPRSSEQDTAHNHPEEIPTKEPLIQLQSILQDHFPQFNDQQKHGGKFTPHMTLSHFESLDQALKGKERIESWWKPLQFTVEEIYVLKRVGDDGQFHILATLPLGGKKEKEEGGRGVVLHDPPVPFPAMPLVEEDWVKQERMKLKARRNGNGRRNGTRRRRRGGRRNRNGTSDGVRHDRGPSRSRDTPEIIAQKRAERAAKRERLELERFKMEEQQTQE